MNSKAETLKAAALEKGDHSQLCTKNIDGQMFLMLASEFENSDSDDSDTDSCNSAGGNSDSQDSDTEISVSLLDENGQEMEEISIADVPHSPMISIPNLLKNLPAFPEFIPKPVNKISSFTLPTTAATTAGGTLRDRVKILPITSSSPSALSSTPHNTYIIKTTMPLSSLDLKSLLYSTGSFSRLAPKTQSDNTTKIPETVIYPKNFSTDHTYVSTYRSSQTCSFSSSTTPISRVSQKPITATTNFITAPISSVNHINTSLTDKSVLQTHSSSLNNTNNLIHVHVNPTSKLVQSLPNQIATANATDTNQLVQSFPTSSTNVIKPITPLLDTGQQVPKVQTANTSLVGTFLTSVTSSDVQSKSLPSDRSAQLVSISLPDNSNSHMTPCLLISNARSNTSLTESVKKKPIVHAGFVPQNLVSNIINPGPGQTTVINNVASTVTNPTLTPVLDSKDKISIVPNSLQPVITLTSSMCTSVASVTKTDSNSFSTTTVSSSTSALPIHKSVAGVNKTDSSRHLAPPIINSSSILSTTTSSTSNTVLAISQPNSSDGPLLVKIIPKSNPGPTDIIPALSTFGSLSSIAQAKNSVTCKTTSSISAQDANPSETKNTKDNSKETQVSHNMTINNSLSAATAVDSLINLVESKTAVSVNNPAKGNNVKSIWLLTPSEASSLFAPNKTTPITTTLTSLSYSNPLNQDANVVVQKNASLTKVRQNSDPQPCPLIILKEPAASNSTVVTPAIKSSENINSDSSKKDQEVNSKADQEQNKVDDTVQFLKLGSFANNIKLEPGVKLEMTEKDSDKTENPSVLEVQSNLTDVLNKTNNPFFLNDTNETYKASVKIPTCLTSNTDTTDNSTILKIPVGLIHIPEKTNNISNLKIPTSLVNVKTENPTVLKIPNSLVNDTNKTENESILKITNSLVSDTNKIDNNSALSTEEESDSNPKESFVDRYTSPIFVNLNQSSPVQVVKPSVNNPVIKVPTSVINRPVLTLPPGTRISSSAPVGTNLVSSNSGHFYTFANKPGSGQQVLSLTGQDLSGSQIVSLNSQTSTTTATVYVAMPGQGASGTKLVTLPNQVPAGTRLVALPNQSGTGTKLVVLPVQTQTGTQFVTIPSQVPSGSQLVGLTSQVGGPTKLLAVPKHAAGTSVTRFAAITSQATSAPRVVSMNNQALTSAQLVNLNNQSFVGQPRVSLVNQGTSGQQFVPLMNQNVSGSNVIKLPNQTLSPQIIRLASQITPGMKLPVQNLSGNPVVKMGNPPSNVKLLPLNNAAVLQLSQMAKTSPQLVSTSISSNIHGQIVTSNSTNKSNSNGIFRNTDQSDLLKQLQNGEKCAVVVKQKKGPISPPMISTTTANKVVSMQSLLRPKILLKNKITSKSSTVPVSLTKPPQKNTETEPEPVEDLPMTLKIDSIFSLKDGENKDVDYWETSSSSLSNKANNLVETGCSTQVELASQDASPPKCEKISPNMKLVQIQQKGVLSNDIQSEKEKTDIKMSSSPKPIVYARLNKPKPAISPVQMKHYKLHDLSNHFPLAQRKRFLEISRTFKPEMMKSCIKRAVKARVFPINRRIHFKEVQKRKYKFLQPRVMLAQVYIPARMKSIWIKQMPAETVKSLKCITNCIHRVRVSYPKGKKASPTPNQNFMLVRVEGKNIIPYYTGAANKPNIVLKDNSNVPVPLSSAAAQNWLLKQGITGAANIFTVPSSTIAKLGVGSFRNILPASVERKDNISSQPSPNKDDALSLACGIIQDNTLKRKSTLSLDYDWRGQDAKDTDWSLDLEKEHLPYKKKR